VRELAEFSGQLSRARTQSKYWLPLPARSGAFERLGPQRRRESRARLALQALSNGRQELVTVGDGAAIRDVEHPGNRAQLVDVHGIQPRRVDVGRVRVDGVDFGRAERFGSVGRRCFVNRRVLFLLAVKNRQ
jgi:hypothetical protein